MSNELDISIISDRKALVKAAKEVGAREMALIFIQNLPPPEALKIKPKVAAYFEELKNE